jgi:hypothetical protein
LDENFPFYYCVKGGPHKLKAGLALEAKKASQTKTVEENIQG